MKEQLKLRKTWIFIGVWVGISLILSFGIYGFTYIPNNILPDFFSYPEVLIICYGIIIFAFGFLSVDRYKDKYRRKTKQWAGALPPEVRLKVNQMRTIPYLSALICLSIGFLFDLIFRVSGIIVG